MLCAGGADGDKFVFSYIWNFSGIGSHRSSCLLPIFATVMSLHHHRYVIIIDMSAHNCHDSQNIKSTRKFVFLYYLFLLWFVYNYNINEQIII